MKNIFTSDLVNNPHFISLLGQGSEDLLSILGYLPSIYEQLSDIIKIELVQHLTKQENRECVLSRIMEECSPQGFVGIYQMLPNDMQSKLIMYFLKGVDDIDVRCDIFNSHTIDFSKLDSKLSNEKKLALLTRFSEYTEAFQTTRLFLIRALNPVISSQTELQQHIARSLATKLSKTINPVKKILSLFGQIRLATNDPNSFFTIFFKILHPATLQVILYHAYNEVANISNSALGSNALVLRNHLITQIIFDSHPSVCRTCLDVFEKMKQPIKPDNLLPTVFHIFHVFLKTYLDGKPDPSWILQNYESIEKSFIQNISPSIKIHFLDFLATQIDVGIRAFLAWRDINESIKEGNPASSRVIYVGNYLSIILQDEKTERQFLEKVCDRRGQQDFQETLFGIEFSYKKEKSYKQLVDYFIPKAIQSEMLMCLVLKDFTEKPLDVTQKAPSSPQIRFGKWFKAYQKEQEDKTTLSI